MSNLSSARSTRRAPASVGARIVFNKVSKKYSGQAVSAVDDFSLVIDPGEFIVFVGPSGCGKTTTMKMVNRIIEPSGGSITIDGTDIRELDENKLRRKIGYVIQQIGLFPHMTIAENIAIVPKLLGWEKERIADRVVELLELVELDPTEYADRYPKELSGGQQQRVGVARALAADPPVMLMDEPFGATDPITREKLQDEFLALQSRIKKTIIFVTHDFEEAIKLGDKIVILGPRTNIEQFDTPAHILAAPANEYVAEFIGSGLNLKHLALLDLADTELGPLGAAAKDAASVGIDATLRDALDAVISGDGMPILVLDENEVPTASISIEDIAKRLGSAIEAMETEREVK
ncbi:MAG: ABC transporter ATP-binding protein [Actinomycetales bacterium]|nr:ABC transporter ATP-binding protein [Actinomycetales bacterium]